jgi:hypothetical protein
MRRILADHRAAQPRGERRDRTPCLFPKPLEQSPPPAVKRYDLLAREEAGPSSTALAQSGIRVLLWRRPVKDEFSEDS